MTSAQARDPAQFGAVRVQSLTWTPRPGAAEEVPKGVDPAKDLPRATGGDHVGGLMEERSRQRVPLGVQEDRL
eukprot:10965260-Alexandrium_andersonii.AAC.1